MPALVELLKDKEWDVRMVVARSLGEFGPNAKVAVPTLMQLLSDKRWEVRSASAEALGLIGPESKDAIRALTELLKDRNAFVRRAAAEGLGGIGPEARAAIPALIELVKGKGASIPKAPVQIPKDVDSAEKADAFMESFADHSGILRSAAAAALAKIGPAAFPSLAELLKNDNREIRDAAMMALGETGAGARNEVPALIQLLKDEKIEVRWMLRRPWARLVRHPFPP